MKIGISGHQHLGSPEKIRWIRRQLWTQLSLRTFAVGVSSLATGADQMFAELILELRKRLEVVIPCDGYELTFTDSDAKKTFRNLRAKAAHAHILEFATPSEEAFFAAGRRVTDISDLLVAVWDGRPAAGLGGTADVVKYAVDAHKSVLQINPAARTVRLIGKR